MGYCGEPWKLLLVLKTESPSYDERVHMCLSIDDGKIRYIQETLINVWETTPYVTVYENLPGSRFTSSYTLQRRRVF